MKLVDMHVHSRCSDGLFTVEEIIDKAVGLGLGGMALTDHDTTDGIERAVAVIRRKKAEGVINGFLFIPGCEFSTFMDEIGEVHILGYLKLEDYKKLDGMMRSFRESRLERARKILACLRGHNIFLDENVLLKDANAPVGRMHIARELVRKGYFSDVHAAFEKMLKTGSPCYFPRREISTTDVIAEIKKNNGLAVLAHPVFLYNIKYWNALDRMIRAGLDGIEYRHPMISNDLSRKLEEYADGRMVLTAGSDYHGDERKEEIGRYGLDYKKVLGRFEGFIVT